MEQKNNNVCIHSVDMELLFVTTRGRCNAVQTESWTVTNAQEEA